MISEGGSQSIIYRGKTIINFSSKLNLAAKKISYSIQRETLHKVLNFHISQVIYNIFSEKVDFFGLRTLSCHFYSLILTKKLAKFNNNFKLLYAQISRQIRKSQ